MSDTEDFELDTDDGDDDGFVEYEREHGYGNADAGGEVEEPAAETAQVDTRPVDDFSEMPQEQWDALMLERSDASDAEKAAIYREQFEASKEAEAKRKQEADLQGYIDLMREASEAHKAQVQPFLPEEPEPEPEAGDLSNASYERIKEVARARLLDGKSQYELEAMGVDVTDVPYVEAPARPEEVYPTSEFTEMDDATFRAFMAKRDKMREVR